MAILGRGISGLPLNSDSIIVGVGGVLDELPVGILGNILTVTSTGVNWSSPATSGSGTIIGASNLTGAGSNIFAQVNNGILEFRNIISGTGVLVTQNINDITISNTGVTTVNLATGDVLLGLPELNDTNIITPVSGDVLTYNSTLTQWEAIAPPGASGGEANTASNIGLGQGIFSSKVGIDLQFKTLNGLNGILVTSTIDTIVIDGANIPQGTVTSVGLIDSTAGLDFNILNSPVTIGGNIAIELATIIGVSGTYATPSAVTVDSKGRITSITNNPVSSVQNLFKSFIANDLTNITASTTTDTLTIKGNTVDNDISTTITSIPNELIISLNPTGTPVGTFNYASVTVNAKGRITNIVGNTALQNIIEDLTPQLGGSLDVNGQSIVSIANGNITLAPNGFGLVTGPALYDMSTGPNESFATKKYVDDSLLISPTQNLFATITGNTGTITAASPIDIFNIIGQGDITTTLTGNSLSISVVNNALLNIIEDLSPQLGGNLDVNGHLITSTLGGNIVIAPNGLGLVTAQALYDMSLGGAEVFTTKGYVDGLFGLTADTLDKLADVTTVGKLVNNVLAWDGISKWAPVANITTNNLTITGTTTLNNITYTWPALPGSSGDVLVTNGTGLLSFAPVIGGAGSQNTYLTFLDGAGGTTSANAINDIMTVVGAAGITTAVSLDTITITNNITAITNLSDVDTTTALPTTGQILKWNGVSWTPANDLNIVTPNLINTVSADVGSFTTGTPTDTLIITGGTAVSTNLIANSLSVNVDFITGASLISLANLADVSAAPVSGEGLIWTGTSWGSGPVGGSQNVWTTIITDTGPLTAPTTSASSLSLLGGAGTTTTMVGDVVTITNNVTSITNLSDVTIGIPTLNQVLTYNGIAWVPQTPTLSPNLWLTITADLGTTSANTTSDILTIAGGANINTSITGDVLSISVNGLSTVATSGNYIDLLNTPIIPNIINDLADVDTVTAIPTTGQLLSWNGVNSWIPISKPDQNLYQTITGNTGTTTASTLTSTLAIIGGIGLTTTTTLNSVSIALNNTTVLAGSYINANVTIDAQGRITTANNGIAGEINTAANVGLGSGIFRDKISSVLNLRSIIGGTNITVTQNIDDITLNVVGIPLIINDLTDVDTVTTAPTIGQVLEWNGVAWTPATVAVGAGLNNIIEDLTPQLGGSLDVNGQSIVSVTNGNINILPNGTGVINVGNMLQHSKSTVAVTAGAQAVFETIPVAFIAIYIDYVFKTVSGVRVGTLIIATDGTTVSVADTGTDVGVINIVFSAIISLGNILIDYNENSVTAGNLTWTTRRMTI